MRLLLLSAFCWAAGQAAWGLEPSPAGPQVGQIVVQMLEQAHYERHPLDAKTSRLFLRNYIEGYDYNHLFFSKADVDGFEAALGATLGDRVKSGDVSAAYEIYDRFMARLKERREQLRLLTASTMTFTAEESIPSDWHKSPWPADDAEMRERWRLNVKFELLRARLDGQKSTEPAKSVNAHYDSLLDNYKQFDANDVLQNFFSSLCRVYDPHTDYFGPAGEENFNISMRLALVGIGAALRSENGYTSVVNLIPGGPADVDKRLKPGDKIEAVAQGDDGPWVEAVGMKIDRLVALIRGAKGTVVRLRIIPADAVDPAARALIRLVRDEIHLRDQEAKAKVLTIHPPGGAARRIGVIDLPSFYADIKAQGKGKSTTRDVQTLMGGLERKGIEGLVFDLRRNGGGSLSEALSLTGLFIGKGPVVQVKDMSGNITVLDSHADKDAYGGPLVVLTSRGSASASEIMAAALQDYGRAVVIGEKSTFGKGTVQSVMDLDPYMPAFFRSFKAGAIHLTIQKFYRVSGGSTQSRGVIPDISLPSIDDEMEIAESALPNALPYDEIAPAPGASRDTLRLALPELAKASAVRVALSPEWGFRRADIESYRARVKDKPLSLNEAKRRAEKAADEARDQARRKERAARGAPKEEELAITLEALDGVVPSTAAAQAPARSTGTAEGKDADYAKAPPAPDLMLSESMSVLSDMIAYAEAHFVGRQPVLTR